MTNDQAILLACEAAMKASVILAGGLAVTRGMTKTSAAARHLVLGLTIVGAAAVVPASVVLPSWRVPILAPVTQPVSAPVPRVRESHANVREHAPPGDAGVAATPGTPGAPRPVAELPSSPTPGAVATVPAISPIVAAAAMWALGALAVLLWHAAGLAMVARMRRSATPSANSEHLAVLSDVAQALGVRGDVQLVTSHRAAMPATWGVVRPGILLPADADTWSVKRLRSVLHHELAHVARHDCRWQLASTIACAIHWYNPLVWFAARALRAERERACDDIVIGGGTDACDYADHLLAIAQQYRAPRATGMAAIAMARPSQLEGRLLAILNTTTVRAPLSRARRLATVGLIAATLLPTAAMRPWRTAVPEPVEKQQDVEATSSRPPELAPLPRLTDTLNWTRRMKGGQWLRVYTMKSDVVVERSPDSDVHIVTIFGADDGRGPRVHEFDEDDRSIEVCPALPASVKRVPRSGCWPVDWKGEVEKDNTVRTVVRVPDDIQLDIKTGSGNVFAEDARAPIVAGSSEGSVRISTQSWATANVVGGDVDITFLRTAWSGSLAIKSVSGRITLSLPESANTSVEVMNSAGDAMTSFVLDRVWRGDRWRFHGEATLGNGGRHVSAESWTGKIFVKQGGRDALIPMQRSSGFASALPNDRFRYSEEVKPGTPVAAADPSVRVGEAIAARYAAAVGAYDYDSLALEHARLLEAPYRAIEGGATGERVQMNVPGEFLERFSRSRLEGAPDSLVLVRLAHLATAQWIAQGLGQDDPGAELGGERSLWALTLSDGRTVVPQLISKLANAGWRESAYAAWVLGELRVSRANPALLHGLAHAHWRVRMSAAAALGQTRFAGAFDGLVDALGDPNYQVRAAAADALHALNDRRALPALRELLEKEAHQMVRGSAAGAVASLNKARGNN